MRLLGIFLLVVGTIIGVGQAFYVYDKQYVTSAQIAQGGAAVCAAMSPECGVCLDTISGDKCVKTEVKTVRGFPLTTTGSGINYRTNQPFGVQHMLNLLLFILPGLAVLVVSAKKKKVE